MDRKLTYTAWLFVLLALLTWAGVAYMAQLVGAEQSGLAASVAAAQRAQSARSASLRAQAIAQDTAPARAQLDSALNVDVVSVANMLRAAGASAGVSTTLSGALPENASSAAGTQVNAIGFVVEASGSFSDLMRAVQLFESLPVPSTVTQLDIAKQPSTPGAPAGSWHMNAYVRVLTTASISS